MRTWILLVRGINVGGANKLPMKSLREALTASGFHNVETYIQSGNIVLQSDAVNSVEISKSVSELIETDFGFRPSVIALSVSELAGAVESCPYPQDPPKAVHVFFAADEPKAPNLTAMRKVAADSEDFSLSGRIFYLHAPDGIGRSKLAASVERHLGVGTTARNLNTVLKLLEMGRA